jgi:DnaK suppressor protein
MATPRKPAPATKKAAAKATKSTKKQTIQNAVKKVVAKTVKAAPKKAAPTRTPAKKAAVPVKKIATKSISPSQSRKQPNTAVKTTPKQTPAKATQTTKAPSKGAPLDKFLEKQREKLLEERAEYMEKADQLKEEADQLARENEPGDIQFDEEGGEGGTTNIDRELDLVLSAQARAAVDEIDQALSKIVSGTYGVCERCGQNIPRARLEALPYAALCVQCKSGGLSRR